MISSVFFLNKKETTQISILSINSGTVKFHINSFQFISFQFIALVHLRNYLRAFNKWIEIN